MARRRTGEGFDEFEDIADDGGGGFGGDGGSPLIGGGGHDPQNPFGNGRDRPDAFYNLPPEEQQSIIDMQSGAIAGNTDTSRELRPQMPNTVSQQPFNLPRGVSANEAPSSPFGDGGSVGYSQDVPAAPMEPTPTAGQRANPAIARPPTRRVSAAPSAIFGETGGSTMFGKAGGLLGGGRGVVGAGQNGDIAPTEMMKRLLQMFGR